MWDEFLNAQIKLQLYDRSHNAAKKRVKEKKRAVFSENVFT